MRSDESPVHANDTDDDENAIIESRKYEKKIDTLMNEVGTLKNQVWNITFLLTIMTICASVCWP